MAIIVSEEIQKGTIQAEANYKKEIACQIDLIQCNQVYRNPDKIYVEAKANYIAISCTRLHQGISSQWKWRMP